MAKKLRILLYGYNGVNNTGSEAKLLTTIADLKETIGDRIGKLACLTLGPALERRYVRDPEIQIIGVGSVTSFVNPRLLARGFDIFILNEGSTFIDHFSSAFMWMFCLEALTAKAAGMKVVAYANDCGHLKPFNRKMAKFTLNKLDLVMLRNPDAVARMKQYGVTKEIHSTADGAYNYPMPPKDYQKKLLGKLNLDPAARPVVGIAPKEFFWWPIRPQIWGAREALYRYPFYQTWTKKGRESSGRYIEQTVNYADWCVDRFGCDVALISMEHMDLKPCQDVYAGMKHRDRARIVSSDEYDVDGIITVLAHLKFLVTTRYHAVVLSSCSAIPVISVSSDTRCEAVHRELGTMDFFIDYVSHPDQEPKVSDLYSLLTEKTGLLLEKENDLKEIIRKSHPVFVERATRNRLLFKEWVDKTFPPD